jgi:uncharacterized protein YndB with AHSA1/START domain
MSQASSQAVRTIRAPRARVYRAFLSPDELIAWLPPGEMTGLIHAFDARAGGGFEMSLYYPEADAAGRGKTTAHEDRTRVRFVELVPDARIVEAVTFVSDDPAYAGEMRIVVTLADRGAATEVTMSFENLPSGVDPRDNDQGARESLAKLARLLEAAD